MAIVSQGREEWESRGTPMNDLSVLDLYLRHIEQLLTILRTVLRRL